jgi:hypothetical protein
MMFSTQLKKLKHNIISQIDEVISMNVHNDNWW